MSSALAPGERSIEFIANPTQHAFITSQKEADLFSCRMGEGKSAALCWSAFYHTQHNPGALWLLIRDTWENCRATTQKEFFYWFPDAVMGRYVAGTKTFHWTCGFEGEVTFIGLDEEKDAAKLQSRPLGGFGIDEPAPAAGTGGVAEMIFTTAMTRLRQPGMNWYAAKLAQNNPDESHWTYEHFVEPGNPNFGFFKTHRPENLAHLPKNYYDKIRSIYTKRPDLSRRFADGNFGFQKLGKDVTPEWSDDIHLVDELEPVRGVILHLLWDFGLNPTCAITQITPLGHWNILECYVGEEIGVAQLIEDTIGPRLEERFDGYDWDHTGDPAGNNREQSDSRNSAVRRVRDMLGGRWRDGAVRIEEREAPLRKVLTKLCNGTGLVQVDKRKEREGARAVWHALRGGWHRKINSGGVIAGDPVKNIHSHPGDVMGYGAARFFPMRHRDKDDEKGPRPRPKEAKYFKSTISSRGRNLRLPKDGEKEKGRGAHYGRS